MSEPRAKYEITLRDLREQCRLLDSVEVVIAGLIGKNAAGEIVVRANGKITPRLVKAFRDNYRRAVAAGILKPKGTTK